MCWTNGHYFGKNMLEMCRAFAWYISLSFLVMLFCPFYFCIMNLISVAMQK